MEASAFAIASFPCSVCYRLFSILIQKQPLQSWNVIKWKFWQYIFINEKIETPRITINVCWLVCCQSVTHLIEDPSSAHTGLLDIAFLDTSLRLSSYSVCRSVGPLHKEEKHHAEKTFSFVLEKFTFYKTIFCTSRLFITPAQRLAFELCKALTLHLYPSIRPVDALHCVCASPWCAGFRLTF